MGSPVLEWSRLWSVCFPNSLSLRTSCIGVTSSPADRNHLKAVTALVTRRSNWYLWSRDFGLQGKTLVYSLNWPSLTRATLNSPTLSKSVCFSLASHSPFLLKPAPETRRQTPSSTVFFYPWNPSASTHPSSCLPTPLSNDPLYVPHEKSYPQSQSQSHPWISLLVCCPHQIPVNRFSKAAFSLISPNFWQTLREILNQHSFQVRGVWGDVCLGTTLGAVLGFTTSLMARQSDLLRCWKPCWDVHNWVLGLGVTLGRICKQLPPLNDLTSKTVSFGDQLTIALRWSGDRCFFGETLHQLEWSSFTLYYRHKYCLASHYIFSSQGGNSINDFPR